MSADPKRPRTPLRWLKSTSRRTFLLYPVCIIAFELLVRGGDLVFVPWGLPLLAWGYMQYRLGGQYRTRMGGGGPGLSNPPERIVDTGIYAYTRNPMYLGHLIFMTGLAITFWSLAALALLVLHVPWYQRRVRSDEEHLKGLFGQGYVDYTCRVKRWIPGLF